MCARNKRFMYQSTEAPRVPLPRPLAAHAVFLVSSHNCTSALQAGGVGGGRFKVTDCLLLPLSRKPVECQRENYISNGTYEFTTDFPFPSTATVRSYWT